MKKFMICAIALFLLLSTSVFGDTPPGNVQSTFKKMYPKAKLTVLVRNYNYDVVKNLPYIDEVIKIDDYEEKELEKISTGSFKIFEAEAKDLIKPIGKQQKGVIARYIVRKAKTIDGFQSEIGLTLAEEISKLI